MHLQNAKEIKQLNGPLKNWAIFYGGSGISPAISKMLESVIGPYTQVIEKKLVFIAQRFELRGAMATISPGRLFALKKYI